MILAHTLQGSRRISGDWYDGTIPDNVTLDAESHIESSYAFVCFRSCLRPALTVGRGSAVYQTTRFNVGLHGRIDIGDFVTINDAEFVCDNRIRIGAYSLLSWNVILMDSYRAPRSVRARRKFLRTLIEFDDWGATDSQRAKPIDIGDNVWIAHGVVVLPGVSIGRGSVIGARSVVFESLPEYCVAAGNPARVIRRLNQPATTCP